MAKQILDYSILFLVCVIVQVLVFNHILLFHVAVPLVFIYFIIRLPINLKLGFIFTLAFCLGLIIDIFSDTPGINALSCVIIAALKRPVYYAYVAKDDVTQRLVPSITTIGLADYSKFLITFIFIYCFLVFAMEYFSFANVKDIVIWSSSSALLTFVILLATDSLVPVKS